MTDIQPTAQEIVSSKLSAGMKTFIIAIVIFLAGAAAGGAIVGVIVYKYYLKGLTITWVNKVTKTIYGPGGETKTSGECGDIWIEGKQNNLRFNISAGDACKHASRELKITLPILHYELGPWIAGMVGYDTIGKKLTAGYAAGGRFAYSWGFAAIGIAPGYFTVSGIKGAIVSVDGTLRW